MINYASYEDKVLLEWLAKGDEAAFTTLFERYRNRLYYYLIRHTKSPEIAEEIVTDIFMKLWTGRELAANISDLPAFIHKVGYYKAMDFLRTTARHNKLQQIYVQRTEQAAEKQPDEIMFDAETRSILLNAINQLPPQRKLIYQLSREQNMTHEEIARALNLSPNTVNNTIIAATRSIAQFLEQSGGKAALSAFFLLA